MKKQRISPTATPSVLLPNFTASNDLPTPEQVNASVSELTVKSNEKLDGTMRNTKKRETAKGTVIQNFMLEKILVKKLKQLALDEDVTLSEVASRAIRLYLNEKERNK